jgi:hypothetical protein
LANDGRRYAIRIWHAELDRAGHNEIAKPSVQFQSGAEWVAERDNAGFSGLTSLGPVDFLITATRWPSS